MTILKLKIKIKTYAFLFVFTTIILVSIWGELKTNNVGLIIFQLTVNY